ncbi:MAG TPA: hypothetical protein VFS00_09810, partial [Polyangiaceae bacterium]|nr:hypothetical protein [Polyangiaceae bacterium]
DEIARDAQHADLRHEPDPARSAERARLGLLGRIASVLCLIEIYGHAPSAAELRACLGKYIAFWEQRAVQAKKKRRSAGASVEPFLWVLAAGRPTGVLRALRFRRKRGWPRGVYEFGGGVLHVGVVVASELARTRSTLLVRLMAAGPLLARAVEDLAALPEDAHERAVAEQILLQLRYALEKKPNRTPEEQEFVVTIQSTWAQARREGREEGREEGQLMQARAALRRVFAARKLRPSPAEAAQIDACADLATLDRWLELALTSQTVAEALKPRAATKAPARRRKTDAPGGRAEAARPSRAR